VIRCVGVNPAIDRVVRVDGFRIGAHCRGRLQDCRPAGKAANVARTLGRLGVACELAGFVGGDDAGRFEGSFSGLPVTVSLTPTEAPTRVSYTILDTAAGTETHVRERGGPVREEEWAECRGGILRTAGAGDWIAFSGSLPDGVSLGRFGQLLLELSQGGARIALDAGGEVLRACAEVPVSILAPNHAEAEGLLGRGAMGRDALCGRLREALEAGTVQAETVFLSDGPHGAACIRAGEGWWVDAPAVEAASTVGAGDAFLAGALQVLQGGGAPVDALRTGVAAAAVSVESPVPGEVSPAAVRGLLAEVEAVPI
jgi:1-phosphofructokinase family hexose kinase